MKKNIITFLCTIIYLIFATKLLKFYLWSSIFPSQYHLVDAFYIILILYGLSCSQKILVNNIWGGKYLFFLSILPLIAEVNKVFIFGHFALSEMSATLKMCAGLSSFFILVKHRVNINVVLIAILCFSLIAFILQYGENYLGFPLLFGVVDPDAELGNRYDTIFGILHFSVCEYILPIFCIFFFWMRFIEEKKWINLIPLFIFVVFLFLLQNRQTLVAVALSIFFTPLLNHKRSSTTYSISASIVFGVLLITYGDTLFGGMVSASQNSTTSWDIRMAELPFFLLKSIENPLVFLFGHGNQFKVFIVDNMDFFTSDVGFVGQLYQYGFIFVLQYFLFLRKVFKERHVIPLLSKLYIFSSAIHSLFIPPYYTALTAFLWSTIIYYTNCKLISDIK